MPWMSEYDRWKLTPPDEPPKRKCPVCGADTNEVLVDDYRDVFGCAECVKPEDADGRFCEVCGEAANEIYYDRDGDVCGCDRCVKEVVAT